MILEIPEQVKGGFHDTVSEKVFHSSAEAKSIFNKVKSRFLDINHWHLYSGSEKAHFYLIDKNLQPTNTIEKGNYLKIELPGPINFSGNGFDWVRIECFDQEVNSESETLFIQVKPCVCPENLSQDTANFYKNDATNNFILTRKSNVIQISIHGRNEIPNADSNNLLDNIRNALVGSGGILLGSKIQWKSLTEGLLSDGN